VVALRERLSSRLKSFYSSSQKPLQKRFWHVKAQDVDKKSPLFICDPTKGTMKIHSICSMNRYNFIQFFVKVLACFYEFCLEIQCNLCINIMWIGHWVLKVLQLHDTQSLQDTLIKGRDGD
jgi:hypothetical protein